MGLGAVVARARRITDNMMLAASDALSASAASLHAPDAPLLPPLEEICEISRRIALAVAEQAQADGVAPVTSSDETNARLAGTWWDPFYRTIRPAPGAASGR